MKSSSTQQGRVLVIDDDRDLLQVLSAMLQACGYDVTAVPNGAKALEHLAQSDPPDLIVLDMMMPVMDGWQFRIEQRRDPRLAAIPVLVLSADSTPKAVAVDADGFLQKPFDTPVLLRTVSELVRASQEQRARAERCRVHVARLRGLGGRGDPWYLRRGGGRSSSESAAA